MAEQPRQHHDLIRRGFPRLFFYMRDFKFYNGETVPLKFTCRAWREIETDICPICDLEKRFRVPRHLQTTVRVFAVLANAGLRAAGAERTVNADDILLALEPSDVPRMDRACMAAVSQGLKIGTKTKQTEERDLVLEELERNDKKNRITYRKLIQYAMIAGFSYTETDNVEPGLVIDTYLARVEYDNRNIRM